MKFIPFSDILSNTNRSPSGSEGSDATVRIFGRSIRQLLSISTSIRDKSERPYFLNSAAFNKIRVLSGATRAAKTDSVFRNDSLSKVSLELVYGGGDASRKRWRAWAMLKLNNCRFCVKNDRATLSMQSEKLWGRYILWGRWLSDWSQNATSSFTTCTFPTCCRQNSMKAPL